MFVLILKDLMKVGLSLEGLGIYRKNRYFVMGHCNMFYTFFLFSGSTSCTIMKFKFKINENPTKRFNHQQHKIDSH